MRPLTPLMLVAAVGCGSKTIEDPFANSTDPMTTNPGTDPTDASASSGDAESSDGNTDDPTNATESTDPSTTVDPDSGTTDGGPAVCGDGIISGEDEVCDGEEFGDLSCTSLGFMGGTLVCTAMC
ncbi:MAG: hypothetical protein JNK45_27030, partial [Myxococcales bacterium]|nr:hypothetical protein [Myxococcales bacterium]